MTISNLQAQAQQVGFRILLFESFTDWQLFQTFPMASQPSLALTPALPLQNLLGADQYLGLKLTTLSTTPYMRMTFLLTVR